jgi:hypothetical protein
MPGSPSEDQRAIETILGRALSQDWPVDALPPGTRVTVIQDLAWQGPWQHQFRGTIDNTGAPEQIPNPKARPGEPRYWVQFDEPQYDAEGHGLYRKASIWARYLRSESEERAFRLRACGYRAERTINRARTARGMAKGHASRTGEDVQRGVLGGSLAQRRDSRESRLPG